jgi:diaminopimelate epimerase
MTAFFKVSGSGNDFVALAEPAVDPQPEHIRAWCRRGVSLGADGVFVLRRPAKAIHGGGPVPVPVPHREGRARLTRGGAESRAEASLAASGAESRAEAPGAAEVAMAYFNADGHPADLCLNGTRCAAQLAFHLGWAGSELRVSTAAGPFRARRLDPRSVALELGLEVQEPRELATVLDGTPHQGWSVTVGVPHFLLLWPGELDEAPVVELGRPLRHHGAFQPGGTNVSFVRFVDSRRFAIRTYERGVEDETLSCGTAVVAAAALGLALGRLVGPATAATRGGFELTVGRDPDSGRFTLAGDARIVAAGELLPGAES